MGTKDHHRPTWELPDYESGEFRVQKPNCSRTEGWVSMPRKHDATVVPQVSHPGSVGQGSAGVGEEGYRWGMVAIGAGA